jgi:hypothetical protein
MASAPEEITSRRLRAILAELPTGATIDDSESFRDALTGLDFFLPEVLAEIHSEWTGGGLDGIYPCFARKTAEAEIEILGLCCLIYDQTLTAFHLRLQLSQTEDEVSWLELFLGEKGQHGMRRMPYPGRGSIHNRLHALGRKAGTIEWVYKVTFGERRTR